MLDEHDKWPRAAQGGQVLPHHRILELHDVRRPGSDDVAEARGEEVRTQAANPARRTPSEPGVVAGDLAEASEPRGIRRSVRNLLDERQALAQSGFEEAV